MQAIERLRLTAQPPLVGASADCVCAGKPAGFRPLAMELMESSRRLERFLLPLPLRCRVQALSTHHKQDLNPLLELPRLYKSRF